MLPLETSEDMPVFQAAVVPWPCSFRNLQRQPELDRQRQTAEKR